MNPACSLKSCRMLHNDIRPLQSSPRHFSPFHTIPVCLFPALRARVRIHASQAQRLHEISKLAASLFLQVLYLTDQEAEEVCRRLSFEDLQDLRPVEEGAAAETNLVFILLRALSAQMLNCTQDKDLTQQKDRFIGGALIETPIGLGRAQDLLSVPRIDQNVPNAVVLDPSNRSTR
eukprot:766850-Hanusia_phi.AAC.6